MATLELGNVFRGFQGYLASRCGAQWLPAEKMVVDRLSPATHTLCLCACVCAYVRACVCLCLSVSLSVSVCLSVSRESRTADAGDPKSKRVPEKERLFSTSSVTSPVSVSSGGVGAVVVRCCVVLSCLGYAMVCALCAC